MNIKSYVIFKYDENDELKFFVRRGFLRNEVEESINSEKKWVPKDNDRVFFFSGCSVPRFKVREKYSVTIKPEYATAAFISVKGLKETTGLIEETEYGKLDANLMIEYYSKVYGKADFNTIKLKSVLSNAGDKVLMMDSTYIRFHRQGQLEYDAAGMYNTSRFTDLFPSTWSFTTTKKTTLFIPNVEGLKKLKCPIYSQDAILGILNEGKLVIKEKKYQDLRMMGQSKDPENIVLLMEIMANSNYEKSLIYLLLLLLEFQYKFESQKELNHVNFKSLLEYFNIAGEKGYSLYLEKMVKILKTKGQFTRSNIQRITQMFATENVAPNFNTDYFTNGPVLRPEREKELDDYVSDHDEIEIKD